VGKTETFDEFAIDFLFGCHYSTISRAVTIHGCAPLKMQSPSVPRERMSRFCRCEECMQTTTMTAPSISADHLSAILNWVCPECGGRMGGRAKEFQCQGRCGKDWRSAWESASAKRRTPARLKDRTLALAQPQRPVQETIVGREHQSAISALAPDGKLPSEALTASSGRDTSIQRQALR